MRTESLSLKPFTVTGDLSSNIVDYVGFAGIGYKNYNICAIVDFCDSVLADNVSCLFPGSSQILGKAT